MLLFEDDEVVFAHNPLSLQSILTDLEKYCNEWKLNLNIYKTKVMFFEKDRHTYHDFYIYDMKTEIVEFFKYLGVFFFKNSKWSRTQKTLRNMLQSLISYNYLFNKT